MAAHNLHCLYSLVSSKLITNLTEDCVTMIAEDSTDENDDRDVLYELPIRVGMVNCDHSPSQRDPRIKRNKACRLELIRLWKKELGQPEVMIFSELGHRKIARKFASTVGHKLVIVNPGGGYDNLAITWNSTVFKRLKFSYNDSKLLLVNKFVFIQLQHRTTKRLFIFGGAHLMRGQDSLTEAGDAVHPVLESIRFETECLMIGGDWNAKPEAIRQALGFDWAETIFSQSTTVAGRCIDNVYSFDGHECFRNKLVLSTYRLFSHHPIAVDYCPSFIRRQLTEK